MKIPYYVRETFVKMAPNERLSRHVAKSLCTKYLYPGATVGPKHNVFMQPFAVQMPLIMRNDTLLCGAHKNIESNKKVMSKFIARFIINCKVATLYKK